MRLSTSSIHLFIHISNGESRNAWKLHPQVLVIKNHHPSCCRSRVFWFGSRNMKWVYFYVHFFFWRKESQLSSNYQSLCKPPPKKKVRNCCYDDWDFGKRSDCSTSDCIIPSSFRLSGPARMWEFPMLGLRWCKVNNSLKSCYLKNNFYKGRV